MKLQNSSPRILVIALSGIGDALMFSPALRILRKRYPSATIDILCMFKGVEELYKRNSDINTVHFWDFLNTSYICSLKFILSLRKHYDVSINVYPANRWEYNIISFLIGAPLRLAHEYNHLNFYSLYFLNTSRIKEDDSRHNVEENIELVKLLDISVPSTLPSLCVNLTDDDLTAAEQWLQNNNINQQSPIVGFHAGSAEFKNHIRRRWSPENYAELGKILIERYNCAILLFGGPDEYRLNETINKLMNGKAHIVKTSFMTTAALINCCSLFVCNDTGLMHVAAGLQKPIVTIFAYTNPAYVYPWQTTYKMVRHELECSPCFYYSPRPARCKWKENQFRCITGITVDEVLHAVEELLPKGPKPL